MSYLYLIPTPISEVYDNIPLTTINTLDSINHFVVENVREARRNLRKLGYKKNFDEEVEFIQYDKHSENQDFKIFDSWIKLEKNIGLISDAGMPAIADPGSEYVYRCHQNNVKVIPLVGPSSIFLALAASGLCGQNFAFQGYIPIENSKRILEIKNLEKNVLTLKQTQIFIETPYRNNSLFKDLLGNLSQNIKLTVAIDITGPNQTIKTKEIAKWKKTKDFELGKYPCIFIIGNT